ncbi:unnamed protein product [Protopolystoma xenopodis]|uniref:Uncharacterized protein n=1 Tax=Protopolystoma xenopodis TaxID=117903 RepID=A0A3S5C3S5_9PLAT|nr:unnamed protein product [Protopolystoma xenopodis]
MPSDATTVKPVCLGMAVLVPVLETRSTTLQAVTGWYHVMLADKNNDNAVNLWHYSPQQAHLASPALIDYSAIDNFLLPSEILLTKLQFDTIESDFPSSSPIYLPKPVRLSTVADFPASVSSSQFDSIDGHPERIVCTAADSVLEDCWSISEAHSSPSSKMTASLNRPRRLPVSASQAPAPPTQRQFAVRRLADPISSLSVFGANHSASDISFDETEDTTSAAPVLPSPSQPTNSTSDQADARPADPSTQETVFSDLPAYSAFLDPAISPEEMLALSAYLTQHPSWLGFQASVLFLRLLLLVVLMFILSLILIFILLLFRFSLSSSLLIFLMPTLVQLQLITSERGYLSLLLLMRDVYMRPFPLNAEVTVSASTDSIPVGSDGHHPFACPGETDSEPELRRELFPFLEELVHLHAQILAPLLAAHSCREDHFVRFSHELSTLAHFLRLTPDRCDSRDWRFHLVKPTVAFCAGPDGARSEFDLASCLCDTHRQDPTEPWLDYRSGLRPVFSALSLVNFAASAGLKDTWTTGRLV